MSTRFPPAQGIFAVNSPEVLEVLDRSTGRHELHGDVIGDDWEKALQLRLVVQTELDTNPRFLCSICSTPTYLVCRPEGKKLFFRHTLEDGRCSAVTRGALSQDEIDARKYNGAKESWLHHQMKHWIVECMRADGRFLAIEVEGRWNGELTGTWRRPDVRATFNGTPIAFEIQLSTTYINVIAQRREFYRKEGGLLFWVFSQFDLDARRLTQDDVFYNNNRNAFIVNAETRAESLKRKSFLRDCVWATPTLNGKFAPLQRDMVSFDALTLDRSSQRAYFFDFDETRAQFAREAYAQSQLRLKTMRDRFEELYIGYYTGKDVFDEQAWWELQWQFESYGIDFPEHPGGLPHGLLNALYSAKHGRVVGWDYSNFIQVAHHVEPGLREHLRNFRRALKAYNRADLVQREDHSRKWAAKVSEYKVRIRDGDPAYRQDNSHNALVEFLFPEVADVEL